MRKGFVAVFVLVFVLFAIPAGAVYSPKYRTIAHEVLGIQAGLGEDENDYRRLDEIIDSIGSRLILKQSYTAEEAVENLERINCGFALLGIKCEKEVLLLYEGLRNNKADCDIYVFIYLAVAEVYNLPLAGVEMPGHEPREIPVERAHGRRDRHVVVVEYHQQIGIHHAGVVQRLKGHAGRHRAVADHGDAVALFALQL